MVKISVYGAKVLCASCVGAPSSVETYEWLQAAIGRKYPDGQFLYEYVDIFEAQAETDKQAFAERVIEEDLFYPVVLVNDEMAAEGIIQLRDVYSAIERYM